MATSVRFWVDVPTDPGALASMRRLIDAIAVVAVADAILLGFLLWASFTDREGLVSILGPIHGAGFVALLAMCVRGVSTERWGWWFPALIVVTLGPVGSLVGDFRVRREIG
ncbi:hypothetical protein BH24ACT23_BH24ACT23_07250 [soil metagenome]